MRFGVSQHGSVEHVLQARLKVAVHGKRTRA